MSHCCKLSTPSWKSWALGRMSSRLALLWPTKCQWLRYVSWRKPCQMTVWHCQWVTVADLCSASRCKASHFCLRVESLTSACSPSSPGWASTSRGPSSIIESILRLRSVRRRCNSCKRTNKARFKVETTNFSIHLSKKYCWHYYCKDSWINFRFSSEHGTCVIIYQSRSICWVNDPRSNVISAKWRPQSIWSFLRCIFDLKFP